MVGPFIFLDHMGPAHFAAGHGMDVRPHPHIGLATVTYLFEGEIFHRDSLGSAQDILPGAVNWMTAGRGIAHSERSGAKERATARNVHGLQSWVALPKEFEEMAPEFHHHTASSLPEFSYNGVDFKLICGRAFGHEAPVKIYSPLFYAEVKIPANRHFTLPPEYRERALYLVSGKVRIGDTIINPMTMPVFEQGETITVEALEPSHVMLLGGDPLSEPRYIDWNFVSSSRERLEQAKADWKAQRFPTIPNDDHEFIPLPE
jgi:redox-sensitive bicupin YhaK (pirin superfamily)